MNQTSQKGNLKWSILDQSPWRSPDHKLNLHNETLVDLKHLNIWLSVFKNLSTNMWHFFVVFLVFESLIQCRICSGFYWRCKQSFYVLVLLHQDPQDVGVRQSHIGVDAEVVVALWILLTHLAAVKQTNSQEGSLPSYLESFHKGDGQTYFLSYYRRNLTFF